MKFRKRRGMPPIRVTGRDVRDIILMEVIIVICMLVTFYLLFSNKE